MRLSQKEKEILSKLEPEAALPAFARGDADLDRGAALSLAISMKRIADILEGSTYDGLIRVGGRSY